MRLWEQTKKQEKWNCLTARRKHYVVRIYDAAYAGIYYTLTDTRSPVTLKKKKLDKENERVNLIREQLQCEAEIRPKVKKDLPAEVKVRCC